MGSFSKRGFRHIARALCATALVSVACQSPDRIGEFGGSATSSTGIVPAKVLLVVGATPLRAADQALKARLTAGGFAVDVKVGTAAAAPKPGDVALVLISKSAESKGIDGRFTNTAVPVMVLEPA